jgi:hypothetical protein
MNARATYVETFLTQWKNLLHIWVVTKLKKLTILSVAIMEQLGATDVLWNLEQLLIWRSIHVLLLYTIFPRFRALIVLSLF